jgi:hypothetical protein
MTKRHPNEKWSYDTVKKAALSCTTKSEFKEKFSGAQKWAIRNGFYDTVCDHMKEQFRWTYETVKSESSKFHTRNEFHEGNPSAAQWALRNGAMDKIFPKLLKDWDYQSVKAEAAKYNKREDFRKFAAGASQWAARNGVWEEVCAHMEHQNKPVTLEEARREALLYQNRSSFYRYSPRAYAWALRNSCLDDLCSHMANGSTASAADAVYLWSPVGMEDVFKVGISSVRLADDRIRIVARAGGLEVNFYTIRDCANARLLERQILSMGSPYAWPHSFDGSTEFRYLKPDEIDAAFELLQPYEEVA